MADLHTAVVPRLSAEQKLAVAQQLRQTAWELSAAGVRLRHPEWPEDAVQARVRAIFVRTVA
ncbi:MAG: hypothetical protein WKG32_10040 [Gemmatimonadaceae bacterium]